MVILAVVTWGLVVTVVTMVTMVTVVTRSDGYFDGGYLGISRYMGD